VRSHAPPTAWAAAAFLVSEHKNGISLVLGVKSLLEEIQWDQERTHEAEAAWAGSAITWNSPVLARRSNTTPDLTCGRQHIVGVSKTAYVLATPGCLD
jgi:hypothetical protein